MIWAVALATMELSPHGLTSVLLVLYFTNGITVTEKILSEIRDARSEGYSMYSSDEQQRSSPKIFPPFGKKKDWLISSLLLLDVLFEHAFVVAPRTHLNFFLSQSMRFVK